MLIECKNMVVESPTIRLEAAGRVRIDDILSRAKRSCRVCRSR